MKKISLSSLFFISQENVCKNVKIIHIRVITRLFIVYVKANKRIIFIFYKAY